MKNLITTIIQSDLHWENKDANRQMFSDKIDAIKEPTHLIVLPEMFTTGFSMNTTLLAETMDGTTIAWMKQKAKEKNCVITGSFICEENGHYYNRLVWMQADGTHSHYDKKHLFSMGDENNHYSAGNKRIQVTVNEWKICPLICYDLRFPVWARNTRNNPYDLLIYIASWPERRNYPWKTLLTARAIENQSYVIGVYRVGTDVHDVYYSGDSAVINAKGEIISHIKPHEETTETLELNFEDLNEFRKTFPVLNDAD